MNNWTVNVIFMTVIGGIGRVEGPIVGAIIFFMLRELLADLGAVYLIMLGVVAIVVMLWAPKGLWGHLAAIAAGGSSFPSGAICRSCHRRPLPRSQRALKNSAPVGNMCPTSGSCVSYIDTLK